MAMNHWPFVHALNSGHCQFEVCRYMAPSNLSKELYLVCVWTEPAESQQVAQKGRPSHVIIILVISLFNTPTFVYRIQIQPYVIFFSF
jgi:hypothetical protein